MAAWLLVIVECSVAALLVHNWRAWASARTEATRVRAVLSEIACLAEAKQRLRQNQQAFERSVEATTDSVEGVHRALADLSFDLWGAADSPARERYHQRASQVYTGVRVANRLLSKWTGDWLGGDADNTNKNDRKN